MPSLLRIGVTCCLRRCCGQVVQALNSRVLTPGYGLESMLGHEPSASFLGLRVVVLACSSSGDEEREKGRERERTGEREKGREGEGER